jgi:hypothetical protein
MSSDERVQTAGTTECPRTFDDFLLAASADSRLAVDLRNTQDAVFSFLAHLSQLYVSDMCRKDAQSVESTYQDLMKGHASAERVTRRGGP